MTGTTIGKTFADLQAGDVFSFAGHAGREGWEKTGPHQARVVNSDHVRNVGGDERVNVLYAAADRAARLRDATLTCGPHFSNP
jgi:hypothetical protein